MLPRPIFLPYYKAFFVSASLLQLAAGNQNLRWAGVSYRSIEFKLWGSFCPDPKVPLNLLSSCKVSFVFESKPFKLVGFWCGLHLNTPLREKTEKRSYFLSNWDPATMALGKPERMILMFQEEELENKQNKIILRVWLLQGPGPGSFLPLKVMNPLHSIYGLLGSVCGPHAGNLSSKYILHSKAKNIDRAYHFPGKTLQWLPVALKGQALLTLSSPKALCHVSLAHPSNLITLSLHSHHL